MNTMWTAKLVGHKTLLILCIALS